MNSTFAHARIFNDPDIVNWNVSKITNMSHLFEDVQYLNKDLNSWDVSKVTDMSYMFYGFPLSSGNISYNTFS